MSAAHRKCMHCNLILRSQEDLQFHMLTHTNVVPVDISDSNLTDLIKNRQKPKKRNKKRIEHSQGQPPGQIPRPVPIDNGGNVKFETDCNQLSTVLPQSSYHHPIIKNVVVREDANHKKYNLPEDFGSAAAVNVWELKGSPLKIKKIKKEHPEPLESNNTKVFALPPPPPEGTSDVKEPLSSPALDSIKNVVPLTPPPQDSMNQTKKKSFTPPSELQIDRVMSIMPVENGRGGRGRGGVRGRGRGRGSGRGRGTGRGRNEENPNRSPRPKRIRRTREENTDLFIEEEDEDQKTDYLLKSKALPTNHIKIEFISDKNESEDNPAGEASTNNEMEENEFKYVEPEDSNPIPIRCRYCVDYSLPERTKEIYLAHIKECPGLTRVVKVVVKNEDEEENKSNSQPPAPSKKCSICLEKFFQSSQVEDHMRKHFLDRKAYKCSQCSASFMHQTSLRFHLEFLHKELISERELSLTRHYRKTLKLSLNKINPQLRTLLYNKDFKECFLHIWSYLKFDNSAENVINLEWARTMCRVCGKYITFTPSLQELVHHMWIHQAERRERFKACSKCDRKFILKEKVHIHNKLHKLEGIKGNEDEEDLRFEVPKVSHKRISYWSFPIDPERDDEMISDVESVQSGAESEGSSTDFELEDEEVEESNKKKEKKKKEEEVETNQKDAEKKQKNSHLCHFCGMLLQCDLTWSYHISRHELDKLHVCPVCNLRRFKFRKNLCKHSEVCHYKEEEVKTNLRIYTGIIAQNP